MRSKLDPGKVREIRSLYDQAGWTQRRLSEVYGVSVRSISRIVTGKRWQSVTGGHSVSRRRPEETRQRAAYIQARMDQGCTNYAVIARELGITRQGVSQLVRTKKITRRT